MGVTISTKMKTFYIDTYKQTYSVSEIMRLANDGVGRSRIVSILRQEDIYEGLSGPNYLKRKVENLEKIMMQRHGVSNAGQLEYGGYQSRNKIPYEKLDFLSTDYKTYREQVDKKTRINIKQISDMRYCYYTGIEFADVSQDKVNPNDPRKRSIDHKMPVIICYLNDISIEDASSIDNITYVLKYVNSIKGNTLHESFLAISPKIRKVFVDEGYKSN